MYRDYEIPGTLESYLSDLIRRMNDCTDAEERAVLHNEIDEVKDRIRFAWADEYED